MIIRNSCFLFWSYCAKCWNVIFIKATGVHTDCRVYLDFSPINLFTPELVFMLCHYKFWWEIVVKKKNRNVVTLKFRKYAILRHLDYLSGTTYQHRQCYFGIKELIYLFILELGIILRLSLVHFHLTGERDFKCFLYPMTTVTFHLIYPISACDNGHLLF